MTRDYLRDRASRRYNSRGMRMMDGRNAYGSRGGYVTSRRGRGRDRAMDMGSYYPEHDGRYGRGYDRGHPHSEYNYGGEHYGEHSRPMEYEMYGYGIGGMYPRHDYGYDYASDDMEKEWREDIKEWQEKLKKHDKFRHSKDQIIQSAKQMNIMFKDFDEEEFMTTYYMMMSDYPDIATNYQTYIVMAKDFLEDKDSELKGSDKLCAYYYDVVLGGKDY